MIRLGSVSLSTVRRTVHCALVSMSKRCLSAEIRRAATQSPIDGNDPLDCASFFEMIELYYDRAASLLQPNLVRELSGSFVEREKRVRGVLSMMKPCNRIMSMVFPIKRESGDYELIEAYRAQHSDHKAPSNGGNQ
jgi:Glu/Leu/Phe/Val dehydrogenase, dimerisation domain